MEHPTEIKKISPFFILLIVIIGFIMVIRATSIWAAIGVILLLWANNMDLMNKLKTLANRLLLLWNR